MNKLIPVLPYIINIGMGALSIWAAMQIKFAPDKATVIQSIKVMLWRVFLLLSNGACLGVIVWLFASSHPVDRIFVFGVGINSFTLFNNYILLVFINPLLKRESVTLDMIRKLSAIDDQIIERTGILKIP